MEQVSQQFREHFTHKGKIAPIAEKAHRNLTAIQEAHPSDVAGGLHYFAVGHAYKQIDTKTLFRLVLDEKKEEMVPSAFTALQKEAFLFHGELEKLINNIRNINSHYLHVFHELETSQYSPTLMRFITEAFELAVKLIYMKNKECTAEQLADDPKAHRKLVHFLMERFYPNEEYQSDIRHYFSSLTWPQALHHLLFIDNPADFAWKLSDDHEVFTIPKGTYLSYHGCLFVSGMFLYKHEANQLISKIKGFKKTGKDEDRIKRDIFTCFAKKFASQDVNSELRHLVRFRDIIQYLSHYPVAWNRALEQTPDDLKPMTSQLLHHVAEVEICQSYPEAADDAQLLSYAINAFFGRDFHQSWSGGKPLQLQQSDKVNYQQILDTSPVIKDQKSKLSELEKDRLKHAKEIKNVKWKLREAEKAGQVNPVKEKLTRRIDSHQLFVSNGRNQDRFMQLASRFLAETDYFGADARFKSYQFRTTDEQENFLKDLPKEVKDKLKYHEGRVVHDCTYQDHLLRYPDYDMPFVEQNNAVQVVITLFDRTVVRLSIQRKLMVYLLEDALYQRNIKDSGKGLLTRYKRQKMQEQTAGKAHLAQVDSISAAEKTRYKKLLPKRLLHHYAPVPDQVKTNSNVFTRLLEEAEQNEQRYDWLLQQAISQGREADFRKKNKGKQYQLRFVRRAWHHMYWRQIYDQQAALQGHHKSLHITRDEYNDFCRYLFAMDEVPQYKQYLIRLLQAKHFMEHPEFHDLIHQSSSLSELYTKTKAYYQHWLPQQTPQSSSDQYQLAAYEQQLDGSLLYINISHFVDYLQASGQLRRSEAGIIQYQSLQNVPHLEAAWYYREQLPETEYKTCGKLYNQLRSARLEDALLYELAIRYRGAGVNVRNHVRTIMNEPVVVSVGQEEAKPLYLLEVPFGKIEEYTALMASRVGKGEGNVFLWKLPVYLPKVSRDKDLKEVWAYYNNAQKSLRYADLHKIDSHLISSGSTYTEILLELEKYYIEKDRLDSQNKKFLDSKDILSLKPYLSDGIRQSAFHFDLPDTTYQDAIKALEREFVQRELKPLKNETVENLPSAIKKICHLFREKLHPALFPRALKGTLTPEEKNTQRHQALANYWEKMVKNK